MLSRLVCNFKVASGWYAGGHLKKTTVEKFPLSFSNKVYSFKIGDGRSGTNEATINENGILKIPGSRIVQLFGDVSLMKVKLFASLKENFRILLPMRGLFLMVSKRFRF